VRLQLIPLETLKEWLELIAEAVGADLLVSDDADAFKTVANELGLEHKSPRAT
jgi:hypothetical protein